MAIYYTRSGAAPGGDGSISAPFNNLGSAWPGVTSGDTVRLLAGSVFRESFTALDFAGLTIEGWGSGPLPIVSGANIVTSWTPEGGGVFSWSAGANLCGNVAIDGEPLQWKAWAGSLAATALSPGSFSFDFTGFVLYIRPADGSVTGKTISVSVRPQLIDANTARDGFTLRNVRFEQASRHAVAILNRTNWLVEDIEIWLAGGFRDATTYLGNGVEVASGANDGIGRRIRCWHIFDSAVTSQLYNAGAQSLLRNTWEDVTALGAGLAACEFTLITANQTMADMTARRIIARNLGTVGWLALRTGVDSYGVGAVNNGGSSSTMNNVTITGCDIEATRYGITNSSATNGTTNFVARGNRIRGVGSLSDTAHQGVRAVNGAITLQGNTISGFWAGSFTAGSNTFTVSTSGNLFSGNFRHFFRNAANAGYISTANTLQSSTQIYGTNFAGGFTGSRNYLFANTETGPEYVSTGDITLASAALYPPGTLHAVVYPAGLGTSITAAQIIAGNGPTGAPATWAGSTPAPPVPGTFDWPSPAAVGLPPSTSLRVAYAWRDESNTSNVSVSAPFSTASAGATAALSGASASFAQGTESVAITRALSGASASFAQGTESAIISRALTGATLSFAQGTESVAITRALSGASASFAQGIEVATTSVALLGTSSAFAAGVVSAAGDVATALSGATAAAQTGTLAPSIARALSGASAAFVAGTVSPTQAAVQALSGQAATFSAGTLAPSVSATVTLAGQTITSARGTVSPTQANIQVLSGVSLTLAAGTLTPVSSATVGLSGAQLAVSQGVVGLPQSATVALVGQSLSAILGNLYIIGAWTPVIDSAENAWAPVNDTSGNGWTPITWG